MIQLGFFFWLYMFLLEGVFFQIEPKLLHVRTKPWPLFPMLAKASKTRIASGPHLLSLQCSIYMSGVLLFSPPRGGV